MHQTVWTQRMTRVTGLGLALVLGAVGQTPPGPLNLTLQDALDRARANSPQMLSANLTALIAREDTRQAKAALLPAAGGVSQFIYTQLSLTARHRAVFVSNDGPHIPNNQLGVHGDIYAPSKIADYRKSQVAELIARIQDRNRWPGFGRRGGAELLRAALGQSQAVECAAEPAGSSAIPRASTQKQEAKRRSSPLRHGQGADPTCSARAGYARGATCDR